MFLTVESWRHATDLDWISRDDDWPWANETAWGREGGMGAEIEATTTKFVEKTTKKQNVGNLIVKLESISFEFLL